jgi:hypothetical protein
MNKFVQPRPFAQSRGRGPQTARAGQRRRAGAGPHPHEKINGPFLFELKGTPADYKAGLDLAIAKGWLVLHESGTFVKFTEAGADLVA